MDAEEPDWPAEQPVLGQLEQSLRCKICHDLFTGPMTLPCGHSYCSQCIRSNFDFKIREGHKVACPECRTGLDPADLRPSLALRDACMLFSRCKPVLLQALHAQLQQQQQHQSAHGVPQQARQQPAAPVQQQQQQQPDQCLTRGLSNEHHHHQQQQTGLNVASAGPSCSGPHSDPLALHRARTRSSTRTRPRASSSPPGLLAGTAVGDSEDEADAASGSQDSEEEEEEGSDADSEFTPSPAAKRRRTGDHSGGKENVAAAHPAQQQQAMSTECKQRQRLSNDSSASGAADAAPAAKAAKPAQRDYAECPVCRINVHLKFIETHVNDCLTKQQQQQQQAEEDFAAPRAGHGSGSGSSRRAAGQRALAPAAQAANTGQQQAHASTSGRAVRACPLPPKLCFNMMKIREVKEKVSALGLPVDAKPKLSKEALVQRYQAFRTFVQSLQDSGRVLSQEQAVAEFSSKLKQQQRAAAKQHLMAMVPAAAAAAGAGNNNNNSSFGELIKQTRARQQQQQQQQAGPGQRQQHEQHEQQHSGRGPGLNDGISDPSAAQTGQLPGSATDTAMGTASDAGRLSNEHQSGAESLSQQLQDEQHSRLNSLHAELGGGPDPNQWGGQQQPQQQWPVDGRGDAWQHGLLCNQQEAQPIIIEDSEPE